MTSTMNGKTPRTFAPLKGIACRVIFKVNETKLGRYRK